MFDEQTPNSERDTSVTARARDTSVTPRTRHEYSNVVTAEHRGIAPSVVVALTLATVAIAMAIAVLVSRRDQVDFPVAALEPSPTLQPLQPSQPSPPSLASAAVAPSRAPDLPLPASTINPALIVKPSVTPNIAITPNVTIPKAIDDEDLQEQAQHKLREAPGLAGATITVKVNAGQVTLSGEVQHLSMKALAEQIVKQIKGVTKIVNEITVV